MRTLATLAGVSPMTVSLALRNHPSLSATTGARVRELAAAHGYRPDPAIAKLMHHLRTRRVDRPQATLCGLRMRWDSTASHYGNAVLNGARRRAESLGFGFDVVVIDEPGITPRRIQRILVDRGVEGLLLLPMRESVQLASLLDWSRFAAVSATPSVITPALNQTMPDLFGNTLLLCQKLAERGCCRIGLVAIAEHDMRVNHRVLASFLWYSHFGGGAAVPPLVIPQYDPDPALLHAWVREHRPDAIITNAEFTLARIAQLVGSSRNSRVTYASTTLLAPATSRFSGIVDNGPEVGAAAVEMLAAMVQRGECGLPTTVRTTHIVGQFFSPKGAPRRSRPRTA